MTWNVILRLYFENLFVFYDCTEFRISVVKFWPGLHQVYSQTQVLEQATELEFWVGLFDIKRWRVKMAWKWSEQVFQKLVPRLCITFIKSLVTEWMIHMKMCFCKWKFFQKPITKSNPRHYNEWNKVWCGTKEEGRKAIRSIFGQGNKWGYSATGKIQPTWKMDFVLKQPNSEVNYQITVIIFSGFTRCPTLANIAGWISWSESRTCGTWRK